MPEVAPSLNLAGTHWVWPDGKVLPRVRGGSTEGEPVFTLTDPGQGGGGGQQAPNANFYSEDQVRERLNAARSEERAKLYEERAREHEELTRLKKEAEQRAEAEAAAIAQALAAEAEAKRLADADELDAKALIARREAELRAEMDAQRSYFQSEIERRDALMEKERMFSELATYRARAIAANADNILPQLQDFVGGDTPQEIDASIAAVIERTASVLQDFRAVSQESQRNMPGVSTRSPAQGPESLIEGQRSFSVADIQNWSMADYVKYRSQLPPGRAGSADRGLF